MPINSDSIRPDLRVKLGPQPTAGRRTLPAPTERSLPKLVAAAERIADALERIADALEPDVRVEGDLLP